MPVRAFVAIELPPELRAELGRVRGRLSEVRDLRWVSPGNIHLTLKFLGDVEEDRVSAILKGLAQAAKGRTGFRLRAEGLGTFPEKGPARVVWAGLSGDLEALTELEKSVETALGQKGFARGNRAFAPHLTLARARGRPVLVPVQQAGVEPVEFGVEQIALMRSSLRPEGAVYETLGRVGLTTRGGTDPPGSVPA